MEDTPISPGWRNVAYHCAGRLIITESRLFPGRRRGYRDRNGTVLEFNSPESEQLAWAAVRATFRRPEPERPSNPEPKRHPTIPGYFADNGFCHLYEKGNEASRRWAMLNALADCKNKSKQITPALSSEGYLKLTSPYGSVVVQSPTREALRSAWHQLHGYRATRER